MFAKYISIIISKYCDPDHNATILKTSLIFLRIFSACCPCQLLCLLQLRITLFSNKKLIEFCCTFVIGELDTDGDLNAAIA